jgi:RNA polymerase sigma-70 factor (ECF subfamily)
MFTEFMIPETDNQLDRDNQAFFEQTFKKHFKGLTSYACTIVNDPEMAEEIVQNMFCRLWEKKEQVSIQESITGYLYRSVYNDGLNYLKHLKVRGHYQDHALRQERWDPPASQQLETNELEERIRKALNELPEKCRTIFQMSRFQELKYQEIAHELNLPLKLVENQMGKALKLLRIKLADYLPSITALITYFSV